MEGIIEFSKKVIERSVKKEENKITIYGTNGKVCLYLDEQLCYTRREKKLILKNIILRFIRKTNTNNVNTIKEISEEKCKQIFFDCMGDISWKGNMEQLWNQIKTDIIKSSNFQYYLMMGDIEDYKKPCTVIGSVIFSIKSSTNE